jgi:hypothetical protein
MNEAQVLLENFGERLAEITPAVLRYLDCHSAMRALQEIRALNRINQEVPLDDRGFEGKAAVAPAMTVKLLEQCNKIMAILRVALRSRRPTKEITSLLAELDEGAELLQEAAEFLKEVIDGSQSRPDPHP